MDNSSSTSQMPETDITALKEALYSQQQQLQKLYVELDEEREASASAASEALSMILRLQGEKAAVKMEASQYKRMAEEKMFITEEYLAAYEDLIYQKEMEISSLEFQIQAYRYKLLSLGGSDLGVSQNIYPENLLLQRSDTLLGEMGNVKVRRLNSSPASLFEQERSVIPKSDLIPRIVEETIGKEIHLQSSDLEKKSLNSAGKDFNSYWQQIRNLDEQVKEISDCKDKSANLKSESRSYSLHSQVSTSTCYDTTKGKLSAKMDQGNKYENSVKREEVVNSACPLSVHDKFEVPQTSEKCKSCGDEEKEKCKLNLERENKIGKPDLVGEETFKLPIKKDETDLVKTMLLSANNEKRLSKPRDGMSVDCKVALVRPTTDVAKCQAELQQLSQRIERLEGDRNIEMNEITQDGEDELNLLKEIREQLNSIQSEMRSWKSKKSPPPDDSPLVTLMEAMLYFWF